MRRHPPNKRPRTERSPATSGYTLLELMIVVVIIGVLAAIAIPTFTTYVYRARASEAPAFLADIKQAQEAYRAEFGQYCNVAGGSDFANFNPSELPGNVKAPFETEAAWRQLGATPDGPVYFQYSTAAGIPGGAVPEIPGFAARMNDFWFAAQAIGDIDGDDTTVTFEAYSDWGPLYVSDAKGWE